jgi:hypothetical protein
MINSHVVANKRMKITTYGPSSGSARIIREPGQNFIRKFTIQNTDTRFDKMYKLIFPSEQESKVNIENWQKKTVFSFNKI